MSIVFQYTGMPASQFGDRITSPFERVLTTTVNDIEHVESTSLNGISVTKVFFQPNAKLPAALAQVTAICQTILKQLPTGITPPLIISYNASSVPILQLGLSSDKLGEQELYDLAINYVRTAYADVPGAAIPYPFGGKQRSIMIDFDPAKLTARGLSPTDVVNALTVQNLVLPSGTVKLGSLESDVEMNASPETIARDRRHPHQERQRGHRLRARHRQRARRLHPADQHRPSGRPARRAAVRLQVGRRLDALHRQHHPRADAATAHDAAAGADHQAAVRPVDLRARRRSRASSPRPSSPPC